MKIKILIIFKIIIFILPTNSFSLEINTNKFCSSDPNKNLKETDLYKIYATSLYRNFFEVMSLKNFPEEQIPMLFCIIKFESNFNTDAVNFNKNGTIDSGLFQINDVWKEQCHYRLYTTEDNIDCALLIYKKQGLNAWVTYKKYKNICENAYNKYKINSL